MRHRAIKARQRASAEGDGSRARVSLQPPHAGPTLIQSTVTPEGPIVGYLDRSPEPYFPGIEMHLAMELGIIVSGSMERDHGAGRFRVGVGQAWVCASLQPHQYRIVRPGTTRLVFHFLPTLFWPMPELEGLDPTAPFRSGARFRPIGSSRQLRRSLAALARELGPKYTKPVPPCRAFVDLLRTLDLLSSHPLGTGDGERQAPGNALSVARIQPALELMNRSRHRAVRVAEAASACAMAKSTFRRCFSSATGLPFSHFELRWRLARAAHELRRVSRPVKAVAAMFGFADVSHFHNTFLHHYGMTPTRYRAAAD